MALAEPSPNGASAAFDWLDPALDALCARGLRIDATQRAGVVALLSRLGASGKLPPRDRIATLITPILAGAPTEQRLCHEVFESALSGSPPVRQAPVRPFAADLDESKRSLVLPPDGPSFVRRLSIGLSFLFAAYLLYILGATRNPRANNTAANIKSFGTTIPALSLDWLRDYPIEELEPPKQRPWNRSLSWFYTEYDPVKWVAVLVPWLLLPAFIFWAYRNLVAQLKRDALRESLRALDWQLGADTVRFGDRRLIGTLQPLRKLPRGYVRIIDGEQTALASAAAGGLLQPRYRNIPVPTDFVALIDRQSARDHLADFNRLVCSALTDAGVNVEILEFDKDPSVCRAPRSGEFLRLETVVERFSGAILLVFGDANQLVEPTSGRLLPAVTRLHDSQRAILMTPHHDAALSSLEISLSRRLGMRVLRTDPSEMARLVQMLLGEAARPGLNRSHLESHENATDPLRDFIEERPERWLQAARPNPSDRARLGQLLRDSLGARSMKWLGATTVYPELRWPITLSMQTVGDRPGALAGHADSDLLSLCRLPWFRRGWMPEWVRDLVQQSLTVPERDSVRGVRAVLDGTRRPRWRASR